MEFHDFDRRLLRLPDSKTGEKVVHLPTAAAELLEKLPRLSDWVLPDDSRRRSGECGPYSGLQKAWERVREKALLKDLRLRDLRHSFASFAIADGQSLFMVARLLGHKQTRTTKRYAHLAADPIHAAADKAVERITTAIRDVGDMNPAAQSSSSKSGGVA